MKSWKDESNQTTDINTNASANSKGNGSSAAAAGPKLTSSNAVGTEATIVATNYNNNSSNNNK